MGPQVYFAGSAGKVYHTTGNGTFDAQSLPTHSDVTAICGFRTTDIYAVAGDLFHSWGDGHWELVKVDAQVDQLVKDMNKSIAEADKFIQTMEKDPD
mgnify:CR=1 FL=1